MLYSDNKYTIIINKSSHILEIRPLGRKKYKTLNKTQIIKTISIFKLSSQARSIYM